MRIIVSKSQADHAAKSIGSEPLSVRYITEKLRSHIMVPECDMFGYLSIESEIVILVTPVTEEPTPVQVRYYDSTNYNLLSRNYFILKILNC